MTLTTWIAAHPTATRFALVALPFALALAAALFTASGAYAMPASCGSGGTC
jgi:hypothetical protein